MRQTIKTNTLIAFVRACLVQKDNLRISCESGKGVPFPAWRAIVLESITVNEEHRQQGHCRRFIEQLAADPRYELVIVEGVQNPHLAAALQRWGWDFDAGVMDFYRFKRDLVDVAKQTTGGRT